MTHLSDSEPYGTTVAFSVLVTDEELAVLLEPGSSGMALVFPDDEPRHAAPVASAVRRSLVARRALVSSADGEHLEPLEPWATLMVLLGGNANAVRVTSDGDDARVRVIVDGGDDVLTLQRDATGVNAVTFTGARTAVDAVLDPLFGARGQLELPVQVPADAAPITIDPEALAAGRAALADGQAELAREVLGEAHDLLLGAGLQHRVEVLVRATPGRLEGIDVDVLDASDLGWVLCLPSAERPGMLDLLQVDDDGLAAFVARALAGEAAG